MNIKTIFVSAALLISAGAAMADNGQAAADTQQGLTREQVIAATKQAMAEGKLDHNEAYDSGTYMTPRAKSATVDAKLAAKDAKSTQQ